MRKHSITSWTKFSPAAYVANGVIGMSFGKNPFTNVQTFVSGFHGNRGDDGYGTERMSPAVGPEVRFIYEDTPVEPETLSQTYDFSCGEFETKAKLICGGKEVFVTYTVFCARQRPTIFTSKLDFTCESECELTVQHFYKVANGREKEIMIRGGGTNLLMHTDQTHPASRCGLTFETLADRKERVRCPEGTAVKITVTPEGRSLIHIASYVPGMMHDEPQNQSIRMCYMAKWDGYDRLREKNRSAWAKLWETRITIDGADPVWNDVLEASYFYLMSSVSEFAPIPVAPYGLAAKNYDGHVFWDTDSYMFFPPLFCDPASAKAMLDYRYDNIKEAKFNAKMNGYRGIQFPWQSGSTGTEVCPAGTGAAGGAGEQHINLDVALAFDAYARVTGDLPFIREKVWPIVSGVAEWIESRVDQTERGYEILHITGIDEETDDVNNDAYTNLMAAKVLRAASEYSEFMGYGKREDWLEIADKMYISVRPDGVLEQYEGIKDREEMPCTTLMAYFPYGIVPEKVNTEATIRFAIEHSMEIYMNLPMLSGFLGCFPAMIGDRELSLRYFTKATHFFTVPFFASIEGRIVNPDFRTDPDPCFCTSFITARASLLMGIMLGLTKICPFGGKMDDDPEKWLGENIVLPEGWNSITISKMYIRGKAYRVTARQGAKKAELEEIR